MEYKVRVVDKYTDLIVVTITEEVQFIYKDQMLAKFNEIFDEESVSDMGLRGQLENQMIIYAEIVLAKLEQLEKVNFDLHGEICQLLVEEHIPE